MNKKQIIELAVKYCDLKANNETITIDWIYNSKKMISELSICFDFMGLPCHYTVKQLISMSDYALLD